MWTDRIWTCTATGVFLGFEVVTAWTDVMACLQTWGFKTGLLNPGWLSFVGVDTT
jgi:hypothetical protein